MIEVRDIVPDARNSWREQDDPYDPRDVVGAAAADIDENITDDLHAAGFRFDESAALLIIEAKNRGIDQGDIVRDVFNSVATASTDPLPDPIPGKILTELSSRVEQTLPRAKTFSPRYYFGEVPIWNPSLFAPPDLPVTEKDFTSLVMPPSTNQPDGSVVNKKRPIHPIPEMI